MTGALQFVESPGERATLEDVCICLPAGISSESELHRHYFELADFPGYYGENWNALWDCLCDFQWTPRKRVFIVHADVPLSGDPASLRIYLEILRDAVDAWRTAKSRMGGRLKWDHELIVEFPAEAEALCAQVLSARD